MEASDCINNFEGAARYDGCYLYAIGEVILDGETLVDHPASVYFTQHNSDDSSRKVTRVETNGRFRLVFSDSHGIIDPSPYRQTDGNDAVTYEDIDELRTGAFYWTDRG